jgi:hypothetical protein
MALPDLHVQILQPAGRWEKSGRMGSATMSFRVMFKRVNPFPTWELGNGGSLPAFASASWEPVLNSTAKEDTTRLYGRLQILLNRNRNVLGTRPQGCLPC